MGGKADRPRQARRKRAFFKRRARGRGYDVKGALEEKVNGGLAFKAAYHPPVRPNRSQHRGG